MNSHKKYPYDRRTFLERLFELISPGPDSKSEFFEILQQAKEKNIMDEESLSMIEGILQISELQAKDIMIPRAQIDSIDSNDSLENIIKYVVQKGHSRFPIYNSDNNKIIGILMAKDLLKLSINNNKFDLLQNLRPVVFIPPSKPLNILLKEFRNKKNHIAIVIDEYSEVLGLVTIEDTLEQITGDIEDEYDYDEENQHIISTVGDNWRIKGLTDIKEFNKYFKTNFEIEGIDTIGGLLTNYFGKIPYKGEVALINNIRFEILRTDSRQIHLILVRKILNI